MLRSASVLITLPMRSNFYILLYYEMTCSSSHSPKHHEWTPARAYNVQSNPSRYESPFDFDIVYRFIRVRTVFARRLNVITDPVTRHGFVKPFGGFAYFLRSTIIINYYRTRWVSVFRCILDNHTEIVTQPRPGWPTTVCCFSRFALTVWRVSLQ